jgi:hypothetical protein
MPEEWLALTRTRTPSGSDAEQESLLSARRARLNSVCASTSNSANPKRAFHADTVVADPMFSYYDSPPASRVRMPTGLLATGHAQAKLVITLQ